MVDLSERTVSPGFIDTHVHLTMDASISSYKLSNLPIAMYVGSRWNAHLRCHRSV